MNQDSLKNCVATLERVRNAHYSQLDTRVLTELDDVIAELKKFCDNEQSEAKLGTLSFRALQVISQIVELVSNLTDLMQ